MNVGNFIVLELGNKVVGKPGQIDCLVFRAANLIVRGAVCVMVKLCDVCLSVSERIKSQGVTVVTASDKAARAFGVVKAVSFSDCVFGRCFHYFGRLFFILVFGLG